MLLATENQSTEEDCRIGLPGSGAELPGSDQGNAGPSWGWLTLPVSRLHPWGRAQKIMSLRGSHEAGSKLHGKEVQKLKPSKKVRKSSQSQQALGSGNTVEDNKA